MSALRSILRRLAARTPLGRRIGLDRAWREEAFRRYVVATRLVAGSSDMRDHAAVGRAYRAFLRTYLNRVEAQLMEAEDEIVRLRAALAAMREAHAGQVERGSLRVIVSNSGDAA
jgi:hypothetical protein